jgi:hypothetical protein
MLVSSANIMGTALCSTALGKSLIYTKDSKGPSIGPCSTPYFILVHFEVVVVFWYELMMYNRLADHDA